MMWRVLWWNFEGFHDWIGPGPVRSGGVYKKRPRKKKLPPQLCCDFATREEADEFAAAPRHDPEILAQIIELPKPRLYRPQNEMLPGPWPLQARDE
jgi:hypothetical protein